MQSPVPALIRQLAALKAILAKGEAHAAARGEDPAALLALRLAPDMFPLARQVQVACDHARLAVGRLQGQEPERWPHDEASLAELQGRIDRTLAALRAVPDDAFEGADERPLTRRLGGAEVTVTGRDYLWHTALPNFFFHVAMAYGVLRAHGVKLGKGDYLGT